VAILEVVSYLEPVCNEPQNNNNQSREIATNIATTAASVSAIQNAHGLYIEILTRAVVWKEI
jgi:hypothetical protein